jgi:hypothetical protein
VLNLDLQGEMPVANHLIHGTDCTHWGDVSWSSGSEKTLVLEGSRNSMKEKYLGGWKRNKDFV